LLPGAEYAVFLA